MAQLVKNLPAMPETWVQFLGWDDPLEKEMATDSSVLAWKIPWTEEPGELWSMGRKELDMTQQLLLFTFANKGYHFEGCTLYFSFLGIKRGFNIISFL